MDFLDDILNSIKATPRVPTNLIFYAPKITLLHNNEVITISPLGYYFVKNTNLYVITYELKYKNTDSDNEKIATIPYYISNGNTNNVRVNALLPFLCFNSMSPSSIKKDTETGKELPNLIALVNYLNKLDNIDNIDIRYVPMFISYYNHINKINETNIEKIKQFLKSNNSNYIYIRSQLINRLKDITKYSPVLDNYVNKNIVINNETSTYRISDACPNVTDLFAQWQSDDLLFKYSICNNITVDKIYNEVFGESMKTSTGPRSFLHRITNILDLVLCVSSHKLSYKFSNIKNYINLDNKDTKYILENYPLTSTKQIDESTIVIYENLINVLNSLHNNVKDICTIEYEIIDLGEFNKQDKYMFNKFSVSPTICKIDPATDTNTLNQEAIINTDTYIEISNIFFTLFKNKYDSTKETSGIVDDKLSVIFKDLFLCNKTDLQTTVKNWGSTCVNKLKDTSGNRKRQSEETAYHISKYKKNGGYYNKYKKYNIKYHNLNNLF